MATCPCACGKKCSYRCFQTNYTKYFVVPIVRKNRYKFSWHCKLRSSLASLVETVQTLYRYASLLMQNHCNEFFCRYIGRLDVVTETFDRNRRGKLDMRRTEQMCGKVPCVEWIKFDPSSQNLTLSIRPQDVLDREVHRWTARFTVRSAHPFSSKHSFQN